MRMKKRFLGPETKFIFEIIFELVQIYDADKISPTCQEPLATGT